MYYCNIPRPVGSPGTHDLDYISWHLKVTVLNVLIGMERRQAHFNTPLLIEASPHIFVWTVDITKIVMPAQTF